MSARLSHSQVQTLNTCSVQHQLERRFKVKGRPHMSTIAGSAFHRIAELEMLYENGVDVDQIPEVEDALEQAITEATFDTPWTEDDIRISRTLPKGYRKADFPNGADKQFMLTAIPQWLREWRAWYRSIPFHVLMLPDEEHGGATAPALEVELKFELGGHEVLGYVDVILQHNETGGILPVDYKSGARHISGTQQLGTYKVGLKEVYGLDVTHGAFYYAREGQAQLEDLTHWTKERLDVIYAHSGQIIEQGLYVPNFESCDYMCSVKEFCPYVGGAMSDQVQIPGVNAPKFLGMPEVRGLEG